VGGTRGKKGRHTLSLRAALRYGDDGSDVDIAALYSLAQNSHSDCLTPSRVRSALFANLCLLDTRPHNQPHKGVHLQQPVVLCKFRLHAWGSDVSWWATKGLR
jgi:hypothetical protein